MAEKFDLSVVLKFIDKASPGMKKIGSGIAGIGKRLGSMAKTSAIAGGAAATAFGGLAIKQTADFQSTMNMVGAVTKSTAGELQGLSQLAKQMGATTQFSATDAAKAMQFMGMAGLQVNDIMKATPKVLQLAAAAQLDMGSASDIVTNIMAGFGDSAGDLAKVNDVLVEAFTGANVSLPQLGEAMKKVGPVASKLGFSFTETTAALGLLGSAGIQGGEAGTGLRLIMSNLVNPTKQQKDAMKFLELELQNADGSVKSLTDVLREFEKAQRKGATESKIAAGAMKIFGERGGPQLLALLGQGSKALEEFTTNLENSGGRAQQVADAQMKGLPGAMKEVASAWEAVQLAFGESEVGDIVETSMRNMAEGLRFVAERLPGVVTDINKFVNTTITDLQKIPDFFSNIWQDGIIKPIEIVQKRWEEFKNGWNIVLDAIMNNPTMKVFIGAMKQISQFIDSETTSAGTTTTGQAQVQTQKEIVTKTGTKEIVTETKTITAGGGLAMANLANLNNLTGGQTEVVIKVQAEDGTMSKVEKVNSKGSKVKVENKSNTGNTLNWADVGWQSFP